MSKQPIIITLPRSVLLMGLIIIVALASSAGTYSFTSHQAGSTATVTNATTNTISVTESLTSLSTVTQISQVIVTSSIQQNYVPPTGYNGYCGSSGQQQCPYNNANCGYPFNPYLCNEGPPVTVTGYLTNDTQCVDLYTGGQTYVVWNLPQTYPDGAYQVYGFVYSNWNPTQPFPPYPFSTTLCVGVPMWAMPPYTQPGT